MKDAPHTVGDLLAKMDEQSDNERVRVGGNEPPAGPTPFELVKQEIDDLYAEAANWLDGEPIASEGQAAEIGELMKRIQAAAKKAEALRVEEKKPFDDAAKEVQDRYNPLIQKGKGKTELAIGAAKKALVPWLEELDRQQREAARKAQEEAEAARQRALEASRAAAQSANLAERERAEEAQREAKALDRTARAAEQAKARVHATGGGRSIGMKTVYKAVLVDPAAAIEHYRKLPYGAAALKECMIQLAQGDVRSNPLGAIPGFRIDSEKVPA